MPYIGQSPTQAAFVTDTFSGNGSTTAFTMSVAPAGTTSVLVAVSGVLQDPSTYSVSGLTLTFSAAPPTGTGNISARYLGIPASGVTTTAYRTITEFTATAGQTTFTPPSYTVGFIQVFRNGVLLGSADYTATNGTTVVLATGATSGDLVTVLSFYVSSVLNAIPATAGSVANAYLGPISTLPVTGGYTATLPAATGTVMVSGNMPAFSAYATSNSQTIATSTFTKIQFTAKEFDTANCFDSTTNYRFTPTVAGYYQVNLAVGFSNSAIGLCLLSIFKNGARFKDGTIIPNANIGPLCVASALIYFNGTTDYIEGFAYQTSGGNLTVSVNSGSAGFFQACLVRTA